MESEGQLKKDAVGFWSGLAIALDSTAPAYSLAAVIGIIVVGAGLQAPAILLLAFIPMFLTSLAYAKLNQIEPDCGTSFAWVRRAMGPFMGWVTGFAVLFTGILVIGSLAEVAATYTYELFDIEASRDAIVAGTVVVIAAMTALTVVGTEVSAKAQTVMVTLQVGFLLLFAVWTLAKGGVETPSLSWLNPFKIDSFSALSAGLLTAVFIYWGWESAVSVNEETKESATSPGKSALSATVILLGTYVLVGFAVVAWGGVEGAAAFEDDYTILAAYADQVMPGALDKLVVLAVLTSGLASTQTTILPASRTSLSMARHGAFPAMFARIHPRFSTPAGGTVAIAVLAVVYYIPFRYISENFLFDTIASLGIMIAFYYAMTGFACAVLFFRDPNANKLTQVVAPLIGATILLALFVKALVDYADPDASYSGAFLGVGPPLLIGAGGIVLGMIGALYWWRTSDGRYWNTRDPLPVVEP